MLAPSSDRTPAADGFEPIPFHDPAADIGRAQQRPTWWLDEGEHARLLGVKPRPAKAAKSTRQSFTAKRRAEPPPPAPEPVETAPSTDFAALSPTLAALDRVLQPPAFDAPGLAPRPFRRRIKRIGRVGVALGLATVMAAVVFFR